MPPYGGYLLSSGVWLWESTGCPVDAGSKVTTSFFASTPEFLTELASLVNETFPTSYLLLWYTEGAVAPASSAQLHRLRTQLARAPLGFESAAVDVTPERIPTAVAVAERPFTGRQLSEIGDRSRTLFLLVPSSVEPEVASQELANTTAVTAELIARLLDNEPAWLVLRVVHSEAAVWAVQFFSSPHPVVDLTSFAPALNFVEAHGVGEIPFVLAATA